MKKVLFAFEDADFKVLSTYESLGFTVEIDDAVNNIYYVELDLSNHDILSLMAVLDDCGRNNLRVGININGTIYDSKWDIEEIDAMVAANPLAI